MDTGQAQTDLPDLILTAAVAAGPVGSGNGTVLGRGLDAVGPAAIGRAVGVWIASQDDATRSRVSDLPGDGWWDGREVSDAPDLSGFDRPIRGALLAFFAACDCTVDSVDAGLAQRIGMRALRDPSTIEQIVEDEMRPVVKGLVARLRALGKETKELKRRCRQEIPVLVARLCIPLRMRCVQEIEQAALATALQEITKRAGQRVPNNKDEVRKILEVEVSKAFQVVVDRMRVLGLGNVDAEEATRRRFAVELSERLRGPGLL